MKLTPRRALVIFVLGGLALCAGLAWVTRATLRLERTEWDALNRSVFEEDVRLALWRMDAALAAWIAAENSRPGNDFVDASTPTAMQAAEPSLVRARLEIGPEDSFAMSPAGERPSWLDRLARPAALARSVDKPEKAPELPPPPPPSPAEVELEKIPTSRDPWAVLETVPGVQVDRINVGGNESRQSAYGQQQLNRAEFDQRRQLAAQSTVRDPPAGPERVRVGSALAPRWLDGELLLTRAVERRGRKAIQVTWLDGRQVAEWLLSESRELLPEARLEPVVERGGGNPGRRLALLPLRLEVGTPSWPPPPRWSRLRLTLAAVWGASLLVLVGLGAILVAAVRLSQRRGDFVSAVTHELRTPLTTVRLYTDLLASDMVPVEERRDYLATLQREGDRLGHLVGNVLSFARLERGSGDRGPRFEKVGFLLDDAVPRIREHAERRGLRLAVDTTDGHRKVVVRADPESVGQILLNLTDNACKYAGEGTSAELRLETRVEHGAFILRVRDFGAGVPAGERRQLFRPFHRSARDAAGRAPGVGLGLALSRRLARQLGGDLRLANVDPGAAFELVLRIVGGTG